MLSDPLEKFLLLQIHILTVVRFVIMYATCSLNGFAIKSSTPLLHWYVYLFLPRDRFLSWFVAYSYVVFTELLPLLISINNKRDEIEYSISCIAHSLALTLLNWSGSQRVEARDGKRRRMSMYSYNDYWLFVVFAIYFAPFENQHCHQLRMI